jgi:polygalacturonase
MKLQLSRNVCLSILLLGASAWSSLRAQPACSLQASQYHLIADGITLNTKELQRYIDDAAHCRVTVTLPAGTYRTGSLFLKSGMTLLLNKDVTLIGSQDIADYPEMPTRIAGLETVWPAALLNVYKQTNVTITGAGTVDGDGKRFWDSYWSLRKLEEPKGLRWASDYDAKRPRLIQIFDSSRVKLGGGLNLHRSGFWTVHICYSHDVSVDGVTIRNNIDGKGPSTDGIDIDSSNSVEVQHADISVNDDALCLKAGRDADGLRVNRPTTNIRLHDNVIREGAAGITFGSETSGGFRHIEAWNITTMEDVPVGILFKSAHTRGGFAEDIQLHDFVMKNTPVVLRITMNWNPAYSYAVIPAGLKNYPSYYTTLTTHVTPEARGHARVSNVHIWNIKATGAKTVFEVAAYPDLPLDNFQFDHLDIHAQTAGHIADASHWHFSETELHIADGSSIAVSNVSDVIGIPTHPSDAKQDVDTVKTSLQIRINTKPFAISDAFASVCSHT